MKTIRLPNGQFREVMSYALAEVLSAKATILGSGINYAAPKSDVEKSAILASFGWGDDNNNFYPDLNVKKSVYPKADDFVIVPFRLISATIVAAGTWRATDFSDEAVLKASASKLDGKPLYSEHDTTLTNLLGTVLSPKWSQSFTDSTGLRIPAGIDGLVSIDAVCNPKIARSVLYEGITSNSVTVVFDWKPSHNFEDMDTFLDMVGSIAEDGKMIRRIVTKIHDYYESSLVFLGADPFAKRIAENGDLVHVDKVNVYQNSFSLELDGVKDLYKKEKSFVINAAIAKELVTLHLTNPFTSDVHPKKSKLAMKKEALDLLLQMLGVTSLEDITPEMINGLSAVPTEPSPEIASNAAIATKAISLMKAADSTSEDFSTFAQSYTFVKESEIASLKATVAELQEAAAFGKETVGNQRKEVERLYRLAHMSNPSDAIIALIGKASPAELTALAEQYGAKAIGEFSGRCKKCGSNEISMQSATGGDAPVYERAEKTLDEIREQHAKPFFFPTV